MTNQELKSLAEWTLKNYGEVAAAHCQLSHGVIRLLQENEAMRGALESIIAHHEHINAVSNPHPALQSLSETYYARARQALSHLPRRRNDQ